jgi:hypothetical protein
MGSKSLLTHSGQHVGDTPIDHTTLREGTQPPCFSHLRCTVTKCSFQAEPGQRLAAGRSLKTEPPTIFIDLRQTEPLKPLEPRGQSPERSRAVSALQPTLCLAKWPVGHTRPLAAPAGEKGNSMGLEHC